ncbi:hypothetical protein BFV94_3258 [Alteromonas macleodii]|uniref:Uncharacterized protein n=1 Tax=Alteromonas macleodii TaxID=28108 RepID=A0AB36FVH6_ALTMA|nr:hypothetical protein BFV93_3248 [Alteromonas macleodii]OES28776.1 hypothetical protein BFV94_3258 [Alteromonas macleodii]OES29191.1 hypothetical protein BFV95_3259 [Alteromonas macleodii]OES40143.1 hypothetical protein BFV96_3242 [Alteromonas macleodii]
MTNKLTAYEKGQSNTLALFNRKRSCKKYSDPILGLKKYSDPNF